MIDVFALGLGLMVAAWLGVGVIEALIKRAELGAALVLVVTVLRAILVEGMPSLTLPIGPKVEMTDVVFTLLLTAAIARLLRLPRFTTLQRWLLLLGIMLLASLIRGAMEFGIEGSVSEFRLYMYFAGGALYFATFPPSTSLNDRIGRIWLATSVAMMVLVCLRWLANFAGINLGVPAEQYGADAAIRVIDGPYTFFLAHAFMLTVPAWLMRDDRARGPRRLGALLLLFVVLLNRRTVWLAVLAGTAVLMLRNRRLGRRALVMVAGAAVITAGVLFALSGLGNQGEPLAQSARSTGTLEWRLKGWSRLIASWSEEPGHLLVGQPFGSGFARRTGGALVVSHPHNFYIETLLRTGAAGFVALAALTAGLLRALWRTPPGGGGLLAPGVFPALLTMQLVWFITWVPGWEQGIVTGLALSLAAARVRGRPPFPQPVPAGHHGQRAVLQSR